MKKDQGVRDASEHSSLSKNTEEPSSRFADATPWIYGMTFKGVAYSITRQQLVKFVKTMAAEESLRLRQSDHASCHPVPQRVTVTCMYPLHSSVPRVREM